MTTARTMAPVKAALFYTLPQPQWRQWWGQEQPPEISARPVMRMPIIGVWRLRPWMPQQVARLASQILR